MPTPEEHRIVLQVRDALQSPSSKPATALAQDLGSAGLQWQPEILALLTHPELSQHYMSTIMQAASISTMSMDVTGQALILSAIGRLGYMFPTWRHAAQSFSFQGRLTTLLEEWAMTRLHRPSDETMGPAFVLKNAHGCRIELRRSCIVLSAAGRGILVIRNNSFHWGRDLLPHAAMYASGKALRGDGDDNYQAELVKTDDIGLADLTSPEVWQSATVMNMQWLLDQFGRHEMSLSRWLVSEGAAALNALGCSILLLGKNQPILAEVAMAMPPWFPLQTVPIMDGNAMQLLGRAAERGNIVRLLSSAMGDMPA